MNKLFTKVATLCVGLAMAAGVGVAVGASSKADIGYADGTYTVSLDADSSGTHDAHWTTADQNSFTFNNVTWATSISWVGDVSFAGSNKTNIVHIGAKDKAASEIRLSTSDISGTITSVTVNCASYKSLHSVEISVGGNPYVFGSATSKSTPQADATSWEKLSGSLGDCTATGSSSGEIAIVFTAAEGARATYIQSISVTYSGGSVDQFDVTDNVEYGSLNVSKVNEGATLNATITPDFGYVLPETLNDVTMGGSPVAYSYNASTGVVTVNNVSGNIVISGSCPEKTGPTPVILPDGAYSAELVYANPIPEEINVTDGQSANVGVMTVGVANVTLDTNYKNYVIGASGQGVLTLTNCTNAAFKSIQLDFYRYDNMIVSVDGTQVHNGNNQDYNQRAQVSFDVSGSSTITISTCNNYTAKLYGVSVTMQVGTGTISVTGVSLNAQSGKIAVGTTRQLTATVAPSGATNKNVSWSAEPESVATVNDTGLVTGVAAGEAIITVTTEDGGFVASYTATVGVPSYGTESAPLTVEEAREALEYTDATTTSSKLYVYGEVYSSSYDSKYQDYLLWLKSSDGSVNEYFEIYSGSISSAITEDDTQSNALKGQMVICCGYGKIHNGSVYELLKANDEKPTIAKYEAPQPAEYTISYNANGGTGEMASTVGESPAVAACTFTRDGYTFTGWNSAADGSGESYEVAQVVSKDVELFAQWEAESPAVTDWSQAFKDKYYEVFGEGKEVILPPFLTADYANDEVITWYDGQGLPLCDIDLVDDESGTNFLIIDKAIDESSDWTYFGPSSNYPANQGYIYVANDYSAFAVTYIYMNDQNEVHSGVSFETILSIALESDSAKKNYYVGDNLDTTGLVVHYALADGDWNSNLEITSWTASPSVFTEAGEQNVTVSVTLQGKVYSLKYTVNVEEFVPASLALSGEYKTVFEYEEEFSHEGLVVTATMGDETTRDVSSIAEFSGYDSKVAGEQTITVEVAGVTTTYTVTVKEYVPVMTGIEVSKNPTKVEYEVGEEFDPSGIEVKAVYDVGDPVVVDLKDVSFSGFDSATVGEKTVTVSYGDFSTTIKVTVKKAAYTAEQFAEDFLAEIEKVCKGYDGKKNNKSALSNVWTKMSARYNELSSEEKTKIANATPKADGDAIQRMLTFYNYACKKYGLTKFISTQKSSLVINSTETTNNNLPIIVIVASAIAAVTAIGVVIGLKRRKNLLVK